jgi:hypothetical protein
VALVVSLKGSGGQLRTTAIGPAAHKKKCTVHVCSLSESSHTTLQKGSSEMVCGEHELLKCRVNKCSENTKSRVQLFDQTLWLC